MSGGDIACLNTSLQANPKPTNTIGAGGAVLPVSLKTDKEGTDDMKSTISLNKDNFETDARRVVAITTVEADLILQSIEALETQASAAKALLRTLGFDHYTHATDNPRTIARLNLTVKEASDDNS